MKKVELKKKKKTVHGLRSGTLFPQKHMTYCKMPLISPGLILVVQKAVLLGLFSGELIFEGAYYWKEFCVSKWVRLDNDNHIKHYENSLEHLRPAKTNSP